MQRNIVSGVLSVVSAKVVTLAIGMATAPLLYRMLGPAKFGEYATVLSAHALFMIFVSSGITRGVRKYVAEERYLPDWEAHVVGFYFRLAVALAAAGGLVYLLAVKSGVVAWLFDPTFETYFTLMIGMVVVAQLWSFARRALMGLGLERYSEPLTIVYWVGFAAIALGLVSLGYGVAGALAGQILGTLIAAILGMVLIVRQVSARALFRNTHPGFPRRKMLVYNSSTVALSFLMLSLYHVDVIMLQNLRGGDVVGHYKAALKLAEFLWFVPATLQAVYVHSTSELWSKGKTDRVANIASRTTRYTLLLTGVMVLGLASLADVVVPLYWGQEATPAVTPLILLLPGALGFAAVRPTLAIEEGHGTLRYSLIATGVAAATNLGLNAALIPSAGMIGAAVATSVGYGSMFVFHVWSARQLGFDPVKDARIARIAVTAALAAVPIFVLPTLLPGELLAVVVVPPVGLAVYLGLAFATGALEFEECADILSAFPGPVPGLVARVRDADRPGVTSKRAVLNGQRWLAVLGILLFVAGTGFAFATATLDDGGNASVQENGTTTPTASETTQPTPPDAGTASSTSPSANGGTDRRSGGTATATSTDSAAVQEDDSDDDFGVNAGSAGGSDSSTETETDIDEPTDAETETATETDSETETETVTDTETKTDTETETGTETKTDTETEASTDTETETTTETDTETETVTETDTETETVTETDTETETETGTSADTETDTETATETETETETGDDTETTAEDGGLLFSVRLPRNVDSWVDLRAAVERRSLAAQMRQLITAASGPQILVAPT